MIGRVMGVRLEETGIFKQVSIAPRVNFNRLEEVFVLVPNTEDGKTPSTTSDADKSLSILRETGQKR
jgi:cell shape-determining protein MreC